MNPFDHASPVTDAFVSLLLSGKAFLDLPKVTLTRNTQDNPDVISGRGLISLESDAPYRLRLYADDSNTDPFHNLETTMQWVPGTLIPEHHYYNLYAVDIEGFEWVAEKIIINIHDSGYGGVVTADINVLTHRRTGLTATAKTIAQIWFPERIHVPLSLFPDPHVTSHRFNAGKFHIEVGFPLSEQNATHISLQTEEALLPPGIEWRVQETLRYVTLRPVTWCLVEKRHDHSIEVIIAHRAKTQKGVLCEPVSANHPNCFSDYWRLFSAYFCHALSQSNSTSYHKISAQLHHLITAESRQIDLIGLLVSIAVEGVLNVCYEEIGKPSEELNETIDRISARVARMHCSEPSLPRRIAGSLSNMKNSRPGDKLRILEAEGLISAEMVKAWTKLRNSSAHASTQNDFSKVFQMTNTVYVLLNKLIFKVIGYKGTFCDFSSPGWPIKSFESMTNTTEAREKAP
jgi:hypothetical protein